MSVPLLPEDPGGAQQLVERLERAVERIEALFQAHAAHNRPHEVLVDAAAVATALGVTRDTIYAHAAELGAVKIGEVGEGRRPRLRFDLNRAVAAWDTRPNGKEPEPDEPRRAATRRRERARISASGGELLPVIAHPEGPYGVEDHL